MNPKIYVTAILIFINSVAFSHNYNCYLKNINQVDSKNLDFDIIIEWTGTGTEELHSLSAGIIFNYDGIANGGVLSGMFLPGSADPSLPQVQQSPNWSINQSSKQIRLLSAIATPHTVAAVIPPSPGFRLGTFRITNTVDFLPGSSPDFSWSFSNGTSTTTTTAMVAYLNAATTGTDITDAAHHIVDQNFILDIDEFHAADSNESIRVFPNPSSRSLSVSGISGNVNSIHVINCIGQKTSLDYIQHANFIEADISRLIQGIYFLELIINNESRIVKFIR